MTESRALLAEYAQNGDESAFRDLVARYLDLVYSTALRRLGGDAQLAEDVAQTVFLHLAKKARKIPSGVLLGGWLHQATCNVAGTVSRAERRRQNREREAAQMKALQDDSGNQFEHLSDLLDEVISQLPSEDRAAVLLRFFEQRDFRSVGEALASSEDAARMRVNRALEKLRVLLKRRGVTISAASLGTILAVEAVHAAPAGLAATVAANALAGAAGAGGVVWSVLKVMTITKLKAEVLGVALIGGLATSLVVEHQSLARLRKDNHSLRQQVHELGDAKAQLAKAKVDQAELKRLRRGQLELLRLRGEVTALHEAATAASKAVQAQSLTPDTNTVPDTASAQPKFQANLRVLVGDGQTLLTGGWASKPGRRMFVLVTPDVTGQNGNQVDLRTKIIELPETSLAQVGLNGMEATGDDSSLQQILPPGGAESLLQALSQTPGAQLVSQSRVRTLSGRQCAVSISNDQGQPQGPDIGLLPIISKDKRSIDLSLQSQAASPVPPAHWH